MSRKRRKHPILEKLEIIDVAAEGKAIAKVDDLVIFVTKVVPGDIVDVQINKKKKNYREGYPVHFHKYSELRVEAACKHFGVCGGCKWQHLPYKDQLHYKQKQVLDSLERIGKVEVPEITPILAADDIYYYRNKLEFTFSSSRWLTREEMNIDDSGKNMSALGFHIPGMFDKIVDIEHCHLQKDPSNQIRLTVRDFALKHNLSFYNNKIQDGYLRNLIIRTSTTNELMVIISFHHEEKDSREQLLSHISEKFPEITSLMYVINPKGNDTITDLDVVTYKGRDHIFEEMEGLRFKIGAKSFYQTNSNQAYNLYKIARDFANLKGNETVYDLYTGTGTIANFIARNAKMVIGVEYVPEAIIDAKVNSEINNIDNTSFFAGDMKDVFTKDFLTKNGQPDIVITDPPRAGMHPKVIERLIEAAPPKIVYVSCNPATQARDVNLLSEKYKLTKTQAVDMFPHTQHVENVVLLERK